MLTQIDTNDLAALVEQSVERAIEKAQTGYVYFGSLKLIAGAIGKDERAVKTLVSKRIIKALPNRVYKVPANLVN